MTRRLILESLLLPLLLLTGVSCLWAQNRWDGVLDRYEQICDRCIVLRQQIAAGESVEDRSVTALLQELSSLRKTLQEASGAMTAAQKQRFQAIQRRYSDAAGTRSSPAATGQPRKTLQDPPPPPSTARTAKGAQAPESTAPAAKPEVRNTQSLPKVAETISPTVLPFPECGLRLPAQNAGLPPLGKTGPTVAAAPRLSFDILALYAPGTDASYGLMATLSVGRWGVWLAGRSNFTAMGGDYDCWSDGTLASGRFWGNGQSRYGTLSLSAGPLWRPLPRLGIYAGAGYSREELDWQDMESRWACVRDYTNTGLTWDAGILMGWRHLAFSAGCSYTSYATFTVGLGVRF